MNIIGYKFLIEPRGAASELQFNTKEVLERGGVALAKQVGARVKQSLRLSSKINKGKLFSAAHRVLLDKQDFVIKDYRIRRYYKIVYGPHQIIPNEVITLLTPSDPIVQAIKKNLLVYSND